MHCSSDKIPRTINEVPVKRALPQTPGYSGKPLAVKLGIAENQKLFLSHAPDELQEWLGPLPAGARQLLKPTEPIHLAVLFHTSAKDLKAEFKAVAKKMAPKGMLWVSWPKKASKVTTDVTED